MRRLHGPRRAVGLWVVEVFRHACELVVNPMDHFVCHAIGRV